jgi:hypothetical protein
VRPGPPAASTDTAGRNRYLRWAAVVLALLVAATVLVVVLRR